MTTFDAVMDRLGNLQIVLLFVWVAVNAAAELVHAWRSKTARSLVNWYTVSFGLSVVGLFYVFVACAETSETSLSWVLIDRAILYMALCLICTHACIRGVPLVLDLFAVDNQHYLRVGCAKCAKAPLRQFVFFSCVMGAIYLVTIAPYVLLWIVGQK